MFYFLSVSHAMSFSGCRALWNFSNSVFLLSIIKWRNYQWSNQKVFFRLDGTGGRTGTRWWFLPVCSRCRPVFGRKRMAFHCKRPGFRVHLQHYQLPLPEHSEGHLASQDMSLTSPNNKRKYDMCELFISRLLLLYFVHCLYETVCKKIKFSMTLGINWCLRTISYTSSSHSRSTLPSLPPHALPV